MKKVYKYIGVVTVIAVAVIVAYNSQKQSFTLSNIALENIEAIARNEDSNAKECPGGSTECARIIVGNTVHLFYEE